MMSCCGRGGSWFGNCGSNGDTRHNHTWSEGLQACKTWTPSKINRVEQQMDSLSDCVHSSKSKRVVKGAKLIAFTSSAQPGAFPIVESVNTSADTLRAYHAFTRKSKPIMTIVTTMVSRLTNTSVLKEVEVDAVTTAPTRMQLGLNVVNMLLNAPVHAPASSHACEQLICIDVCFSFLLVVVLF